MEKFVLGTLAGASGKVAIDMTTFTDMLVRGRPASPLPAEVIRKIAQKAGIEPLEKPDDEASPQTKHRRSALGALSGFGVGLALGAVYGLVRPALEGVPVVAAGVVLGLCAMAATDVPAAKLHATEPNEWSAASWSSDVIAHLTYGIVTAVVFEALSARDERERRIVRQGTPGSAR
jgi:hypothetical protein